MEPLSGPSHLNCIQTQVLLHFSVDRVPWSDQTVTCILFWCWAVLAAGVAKGWADRGSVKAGLETVDFVLMRKIALSWVVTIPFALSLSSLLYYVARLSFIGPFDQ